MGFKEKFKIRNPPRIHWMRGLRRIEQNSKFKISHFFIFSGSVKLRQKFTGKLKLGNTIFGKNTIKFSSPISTEDGGLIIIESTESGNMAQTQTVRKRTSGGAQK